MCELKILKNSLVLIFIMILTGCVSSNKKMEKEVSCNIVRAGIIKNSILTKEYKSSGTTSGNAQIYSNHFVTKETLEIPLQKDMHFGVEYLFSGLESGEKITEHVTHPLITKPNGQTSKGYTRKKKPGKASGYILNRDYELVAGLWKLEYYYNGKYLCGRSFQVQ